MQSPFDDCWQQAASALEQRRLAFVVSNLIVPSTAVACVTSAIGTRYGTELAWVPRLVVLGALAMLVVSNLIISLIVMKCHASLVLNGQQMLAMTRGTYEPRALNLGGVSFAFYIISTLWTLLGLVALLRMAGVEKLGFVVIPVLVLGSLMLYAFLRKHELATGDGEKAFDAIRDAVSSDELASYASNEKLELHAEDSLRATALDLAVVVSMAAALFVGSLTCLANVGGLNSSLQHVDTALLGRLVFPWMQLGTAVSVLLSANMLIRLKLALLDWAPKASGQLTSGAESDVVWGLDNSLLLLVLLLGLLGASSALGALAWLDGWHAVCVGGVVVAPTLVTYMVKVRRWKPAADSATLRQRGL